MASFNKIILAGNITRAPELRYTPKGTAVVKFGIAVNRQWKNEAGEKMEEVCFIDVDAWGKTAEVISEHLGKGDPILLEGRLKLEKWDDKKTGEERSRHGVTLESFSFIGGKQKAAPAPKGKTKAAPEHVSNKPESDDVPF